jgi:hypothetical protein
LQLSALCATRARISVIYADAAETHFIKIAIRE